MVQGDQMDKNSRIFVAGSTGMVGSSIVKELVSQGYENVITSKHEELDLTNQIETKWFIKDHKPDYVIIAAAKVGGIYANNTYPVEFMLDNTMIEFNLIRYSAEYDVKKLLMLGSSCIYPKECLQPIKEEYLLSKPLETTNEAYALAKISGIKLCQYYSRQYGKNFISAMPCSIYGIGDNFDLNNSHFIPALIRKMHEAKINNVEEVEVWGTGKPMREFLFADDLANACIFLMNHYNEPDIINVGSGVDYTIADIAEMIKNVVGFRGELRFNTEKPDGTFRKLLDVEKVKRLGWEPKTEFIDGLEKTYDWFCAENK